jgi:flagellar hook assembly protein FlgD
VTTPPAPTITSFSPASGAVGVEVTIAGTDFTGATSVQFNGTSASTFTVDNATQIRANVPTGAATGKISVTTGSGTAISVNDFTVTGAATTTLVFVPFHDAYVQLSTPTTNYGNSSTLRVRKSGTEQMNAYMKFQATGVTGNTVVSIKIRLKVTNASSDGGTLYKVSNFYPGTSDDWEENTITWGNAPPLTGSPIASFGAVAASTTVEINITGQFTSNGTYSYVLINNSSDDAYYSSTEGANDPEMVIEVIPPTLAGTTNGSAERALPTEFSMSPNYPNPFNAQTRIDYALPEESHVRLAIYNSLGQLVRVLMDETQSPGYKHAVWDGRDDSGIGVGSGVYFYQLDAMRKRLSGRMILQQ